MLEDVIEELVVRTFVAYVWVDPTAKVSANSRSWTVCRLFHLWHDCNVQVCLFMVVFQAGQLECFWGPVIVAMVSKPHFVLQHDDVGV